MSCSTLHFRLSTAAVVSILLALTLSGFFLTLLFERHVLRRVDQELSVVIKQLVTSLETGATGAPELATPLSDPRFERPLSGLYWQVESPSGVVLRSRSLWAQSLVLPAFDTTGATPKRFQIDGPDEGVVVARSRKIFIETTTGDRVFRLTAAINKAEIDTARNAFTWDLALALGLLALALIAAAFVQIFVGLRPLKQIRERINDIRTGSTARLEGAFPGEVQSLVGEVNALLSANDKSVQRARDSAADLAHGLKTPLAVLHAESLSLVEREQPEAADEIARQVEQMRERIDRHLVTVRLRGSGGGSAGRTDVAPTLDKLVKAMQTMPLGEQIDWRRDVPEGCIVPMDSQDFMEVFGNLLDNARKWARSGVQISAVERDHAVDIVIADDGPGVPGAMLGKIMQRGGRLDEQKAGAGLGLPIAQRLLEAYDATLVIENAQGGGVRLTVHIPRS